MEWQRQQHTGSAARPGPGTSETLEVGVGSGQDNGSSNHRNSGLDLTDTKRYPGSLGPVPQQGARARLWPTLSPRRLLCTWVLPAPGVRLAFRAAQPGQASKTAAAALSRWPRALGGLAHVAPTRKFSPVSHLWKDESRGPC